MRFLALIATATAALGAAGCGGSSSKAKQDTAPAATTTAATAAPAAKPKAAAGAASVRVKDFDFAPTTLTVKAGTKVTWTNGDATNHTVTFSGGGAPASVDNLAEGASAARTFKTAGTYSYVCTFHPNMKAKVVVSK